MAFVPPTTYHAYWFTEYSGIDLSDLGSFMAARRGHVHVL